MYTLEATLPAEGAVVRSRVIAVGARTAASEWGEEWRRLARRERLGMGCPASPLVAGLPCRPFHLAPTPPLAAGPANGGGGGGGEEG